jgi:RHS repeat-associated protein
MLAAQTLTPAVPVPPSIALPAVPVIASTTAFLLTANLHQGGRTTVATRQVGLLPRKALGMPVCWCDSTRRSRSTGKERDSETSLDFFGERYFSAAQGRFTSPDALIMKKEWLGDPQRWNHYAYVRNNPLRYIDPNGEDLTIVYSYGPDASDEQQKWFEANKTKIFAAIQQKFNDVGVNIVTFKSADSLSKDDLKKLANSAVGSDNRTTGITGGVRLEVTGQDSSVFRGDAPLGTYGATYHGLSDVFMDRLGNASSSACDAACTFANVAAHEIGHGLGFDDPGHNFMNYIGFAPTVANEWFKDNVMKQGGDPSAKPLPFRADKNQRAIDEVNRAKPFPQ